MDEDNCGNCCDSALAPNLVLCCADRDEDMRQSYRNDKNRYHFQLHKHQVWHGDWRHLDQSTACRQAVRQCCAPGSAPCVLHIKKACMLAIASLILQDGCDDRQHCRHSSTAQHRYTTYQCACSCHTAAHAAPAARVMTTSAATLSLQQVMSCGMLRPHQQAEMRYRPEGGATRRALDEQGCAARKRHCHV